MPKLSGLELLKRIKDEPKYKSLPVIVMTADSEAEVESLMLGAVDFIPKPYPEARIVNARIIRTIELFEDRELISATERDSVTGLKWLRTLSATTLPRILNTTTARCVTRSFTPNSWWTISAPL